MLKRFYCIVMVMVMLAGASSPVFGAEWKKDTKGWWYQEDHGGWPANSWQWINGKCYYFDSQGYMAAAAVVPGGYRVNADGAWTVNGIVQIKNATAMKEPETAIISGMTVADSAQYIRKDGGGSVLNSPASNKTSVPTMRENDYPSGNRAKVEIPADKPLGDYGAIGSAVKRVMTGNIGELRGGMGYLSADGDSPFVTIDLKGNSNEEFANQIIDWYVANPMWNCVEIENIYQDAEGNYKAILLYDYAKIVNGQKKYYVWLYEEKTETLYHCVKFPVSTSNGIQRGTYRTYVAFHADEFMPIIGASGTIRGFDIHHMKSIPSDTKLILGEDISKYIAYEYEK